MVSRLKWLTLTDNLTTSGIVLDKRLIKSSMDVAGPEADSVENGLIISEVGASLQETRTRSRSTGQNLVVPHVYGEN